MRKFGGVIRIGFRYSEYLGPRYVAAGVTLHLSGHDRYEFASTAVWPAGHYTEAVERGVRDGLRESGYDPDPGVRVLLEAVEFDDVDSPEHAFYVAARCAAKARAGVRR